MKTVACLIVGQDGAGQTREVELEPGSTPRDLLVALELPPDQYVVARENSSQAYASDENLYSDIQDGAKLRIAPVAIVGGGARW